MSIGPDALGSKTEASTVRWVPPVTRGTSSAAPGALVAINANGTVAVRASRRVVMRMGAACACGEGRVWHAVTALVRRKHASGGRECGVRFGVGEAAMSTSAVPLTTGAWDSAEVDVEGWAVSSITFPPGLVLPRHEHPHATVAVIVRGGFAGDYHAGSHECDEATAVCEPEGAAHANRFGARPTRVVTISASHASARDLPREVRSVFGRPSLRRSAATHALAGRLDFELRHHDAMTALAVEGLALEALAGLARDNIADRVERDHVAAALSVLHDRFAEPLSMSEIAAEVGVHPVHLTRLFRQSMHTTPGAYQRRLRVEWVARQLRTTDVPIAALADQAGFTDQSHLGRVFRAMTGTTPAAYRRAHRL